MLHSQLHDLVGDESIALLSAQADHAVEEE
jgi:hypothetical protein